MGSASRWPRQQAAKIVSRCGKLLQCDGSHAMPWNISK
jgi:hypothetical protein